MQENLHMYFTLFIVSNGVLLAVIITLIFGNYKVHSMNTAEMRDMKDTVKKLAEAVVAMKEIVQFVYTKVMSKVEARNDDMIG